MLCDEGLHEVVVLVEVQRLVALERVVLVEPQVLLSEVNRQLCLFGRALLLQHSLQPLPSAGSNLPLSEGGLSEVNGVALVRGRWADCASCTSFRSNGCCEHSAKQCAWCLTLSN